jgi:hypothetical protein
MSEYFSRWRAELAAALDDRYYPDWWLGREISAGRMVFRATDRAAIVAEIRDYPSGARAVHGVCAAGDLSEIVEVLIPEAEAWGKSIGCTSAFIDSREAWQRILQSHGYTPYKTCVRKEL